MLPSVLPSSAQIRQWEGFLVFGNFFLRLPSRDGTLFLPLLSLFFCLLYFFLPPFEELGCFSGCLMSSAGVQKLFCGIYSTFKCSFDEFVGEKVFSPSYSSAILAPPPSNELWELFDSKLCVLNCYKNKNQIIKNLRLWHQIAWISNWFLSLAPCKTLGNLLKLFVPQFISSNV